ncbi:hypothetical protein OBBRIDRAFT_838191 [Obba rivulosa]|uniref:RGS domain-containing protein n=1 Tax=Obba rivulosa TaxID=1052685 RepID=A0A8E2AN87_9APHY|nr:hypothetical protein OBBRIDRAFT_838191 [Obba rivulosa]
MLSVPPPLSPAAATGCPAVAGLSQPKTIKLSPQALRALPHRLAHPPPARGILASWSVTPRVAIALEDVLDRKHLPPLGLKDFEEWLLFVEQSAENLYFILWLREYTARYTAWVHQSKSAHARGSRPSSAPSSLSHAHPHDLSRSSSTAHPLLSPPVPYSPHFPYTTPGYPAPSSHTYTYPANPTPSPSSRRPRPAYRTPRAPLPSNPTLAAFYLRAKHTFLTPTAPYELDVPSDALQVFHAPAIGGGPVGGVDGAHPPDPAIFDELAEHATAMLRDSLDRFVRATFNNVGAPRAWCGCAGGIAIALMGSAPPLAASFATGGPRWWRLLALPGMWLGLTIFISALYGVCMMIYIFGDLRQLRSFELVRPPMDALYAAAKQAVSAADAKLAPRDFKGAIMSSAPTSQLPGSFPESPVDTKRPLLRIVPPAFSFALLGVRSSPPGDSPRAAKQDAELEKAMVHEQAGARGREKEARPPARTASARSCSSGPSFASASVSEAHESVESFVIGRGEGKRGLRDDETQDGLDHDERRASGSRGTRSDSGSDEESMTDESDAESGSAASCSAPSTSSARIEISDAFYDEDPAPEGPATCPRAAPHPALAPLSHSPADLATAGFIRPFVWDADGAPPRADDVEAWGTAQRAAPFDFDALPPRRPRFANPKRRPAPAPINVDLPALPSPAAQAQHVHFAAARDAGASAGAPPHDAPQATRVKKAMAELRARNEAREPERVDLRRVLGHVQSKCSPANAVRPTLQLQARARRALAAAGAGADSLPASPTLTLAGPGSPRSPGHAPSVLTLAEQGDAPASPVGSVDEKRGTCAGGEEGRRGWHRRFRAVSMVPAFAAPLTPILSPVVTRAQWEIVVRSAVVAAIISCTVVGGLVGVPVPGR